MTAQMAQAQDVHGIAAPQGLSAFLETAWQRLHRGVADRRAAARHPVLATVALGGGAEARTVVLRGADRASATLELHTDAASGKVQELSAEPRATLLIWDPVAHLQMRLRVTASPRPGGADEWARIPEGAQRVYGGTPEPGQPIGAPSEHDPAPDPTRFMIVSCVITEIDLLHLGKDRHRRALYQRATGWTGTWIAP